MRSNSDQTTAGFESYVHAILRANIYDLVQETALEPARKASAKLGVPILLKREDTQSVFSFKLRGAYNKLLKLSAAGAARGVLAVSAGNHAQGVALAAKHLNMQAVIVMPQTTPSIKVDAVRAHGAEVVLHGDSFDEAARFGANLCEQRALTWVHPYDDADVIAGQGTIAMELMRQAHELGAIFVPVGGGGLIAGIAAWMKALKPEVKIIAVEPEDAASLAAALQAGEPVTLPSVGLFVDGVAVKRVGDEPFAIAKHTVDACVQVSADEVCAGIRDIFEETRTVVEPAGALGLAGIKRYLQNPTAYLKDALPADKPLVAIVCGANMNFDRLRHVAERAQIGEHHEAVFGVEIPEVKGSFLAFCKILGKRALTEFNYRYAQNAQAQLYVGLSLGRGSAERSEIAQLFARAGYRAFDYTDNELAKLHVRHMVGGRAPLALKERFYRVEFPERPGALLDFLSGLTDRWNITLFHYRNHGAAYGRVLLGVEADHDQAQALEQTLDAIGYSRAEESDNPALRQFLRDHG
jgi:threonine dehydratase